MPFLHASCVGGGEVSCVGVCPAGPHHCEGTLAILHGVHDVPHKRAHGQRRQDWSATQHCCDQHGRQQRQSNTAIVSEGSGRKTHARSLLHHLDHFMAL